MDGNLCQSISSTTEAHKNLASQMLAEERENYRRLQARYDKRILVLSKEVEIIKEGISDMLKIIETLKELIKTMNGSNKKRKYS